MVDPTRRKLRIPNWYSPYLEKFRIYELFHELAKELVIQEPADHVLFLKEILYNASASRYAPRVILLAPPDINTIEIAHLLGGKCQAKVVTENEFLSNWDDDSFNKTDRPRLKILTQCLLETLRNDNTYYTGWILPDYPKSIPEAKIMLKCGILPTHVFQFIPPFQPDIYDLNVAKKNTSWREYRRKILALRNIFKHQLLEVKLEEKTIGDIVDNCIDLINIKKRRNSPIIPRVCILGPRGCGRKTQAKKLAQTFNLVHVDFEYLLCQHWISESHLGFLLRSKKDNIGHNSLLLTAVVHKRILDYDCLDRGWVLTGFPNTLEDLKNLDQLDTPPNRIIFLECDLDQCRARVMNRRINMYSGSVITLVHSIADNNDPILRIHPKDKEETINSELDYYCQNYEDIRNYCGKSAAIVNGNQLIQWISETLSAIVMRPLPDSDPRASPEYDADTLGMSVSDTNDSSILECICSPCTNVTSEDKNRPCFNSEK